MIEYLQLFGLILLQAMSFTLVSRARNSDNIWYHGGASVFSNLLWILILKQIVTNFDDPYVIVIYVAAMVIGGMGMHWFSMKYLEKKKRYNMLPPETKDYEMCVVPGCNVLTNSDDGECSVCKMKRKDARTVSKL